MAASLAAAKCQSTTINNTVNGGDASTVSAATSKSLVDLLLSYGCPEVSCVPSSGTLPRRRVTTQVLPQFDKLPSSVI